MPTLIVDKIELKKQSGTLVAAMLIGIDLDGNVLQVPIDITKAQYNVLFAEIALKANNDNVVHLHGQETIDGSKIFVNDSVDQNYHSIKILRSKHGKAIQIINNSDTTYEAVNLVNNKGYGFVIDNSAVYGQIINNIGKIGMQISNIGEIGLLISNGGNGVGVRLHSDDLSRGDLQQTLRNTVVIGSIDYLGNIMAPSFKTKSGLPTQFLKADGSIDSTLYAKNSDLQNLLAGIDPVALASLNDLIIAYRNANGDLLVAVDLIGTNLSNVIDVEIRNRIAADLLLAPIKDPIFTGNGITIPRLTTAQITAILNPVQGTLVFNSDTNLIECFGGAIWSKSWNYLNGFYSVQNELQIQTTSIVDEIATGMSIAPIAGTYKVDFTANYDIVKGNVVTQATLDLQILTLYLQNKPATGSHVLMFVSGEIILPGVYDINGAAALAGIITLDAQGDPNALFVFRVVGAINSVAGTTFVLANGASANNIFWTATGAIVLVANNVLYGNFISLGEAVSVGANSNLTGRLFSKAGAVAFSSGIQNKPTGTSVAPLGILETFIVFTAIGDVNNAALTIIKGNIGTAFGIINMFLNSIYTGKLYDNTQKMGNTNVFSIYANEALIPNSVRSRYSDNYLEEITLTAVITVAEGQSVDIRWRTDVGIVYLKNRIFTLTRLG